MLALVFGVESEESERTKGASAARALHSVQAKIATFAWKLGSHVLIYEASLENLDESCHPFSLTLPSSGRATAGLVWPSFHSGPNQASSGAPLKANVRLHPNAGTTFFHQILQERHSVVGEYERLLPDTDNLALMVLKGHLVLEEMLFSLVKEHCARPDFVRRARLSFAQLHSLAQALVATPIPEEAWSGIAAVNSLRNALMHNLRPMDLEVKVEKVYRCAIVGMEPLPESYVKPIVAARIIQESILSFVGALALVGGVSEVLRSEGTFSQEAP